MSAKFVVLRNRCEIGQQMSAEIIKGAMLLAYLSGHSSIDERFGNVRVISAETGVNGSTCLQDLGGYRSRVQSVCLKNRRQARVPCCCLLQHFMEMQ
jgi:hypothetical protein